MSRAATRLMMWLVCASLLPAAAMGIECDQNLAPINKPDGYTHRLGGERCEGIYVSPVSGTPIEVVSFMWGSLTNVKPTDTVTISFPARPTPSNPVFIRAMGIPSGLYYRMDTKLEDGEPFLWPLKPVIGHDNIDTQKLGVFAFVRTATGSQVYLPVVVGPANGAPPKVVQVTMVLRALASMSDAQWRFTAGGGAATGGFSSFDASADRMELKLDANKAQSGVLEVAWSDTDGKRRKKQFALQF